MQKGVLLIVCMLSVCSCQFIRQHQLGDAYVSAGDEKLYETDILRLSEHAQTSEDSANLVDNYIRNWATEALLYSEARREIDNSRDIENMVADYRRSLYVHQYEQLLVNNRVPKIIDADSVYAYYESHPERFTLRETLLKGILLVLPQNAPDQLRLANNLRGLSNDDMEQIERYAWQYASGYELFTDRWLTLSQIMLRMPIVSTNFEKQLKQEQLIEMEDSASVYLLRITDKRMVGEQMPFEYAQVEIEQMMQMQREAQFLRRYRENLFDQGIRQGKIVIKETIK